MYPPHFVAVSQNLTACKIKQCYAHPLGFYSSEKQISQWFNFQRGNLATHTDLFTGVGSLSGTNP